jgi:hypothetical protein
MSLVNNKGKEKRLFGKMFCTLPMILNKCPTMSCLSAFKPPKVSLLTSCFYVHVTVNPAYFVCSLYISIFHTKDDHTKLTLKFKLLM